MAVLRPSGGSYAEGNTGGACYSTNRYAGELGNPATSSPYVDPNGATDCQEGTGCSYRIRARWGATTIKRHGRAG